MTEVAAPRQMFADILMLIARLLNRGFYGGIAHIAFRDQAIQNLDDHVANPLKSTETQRCQSRAWFRPASRDGYRR